MSNIEKQWASVGLENSLTTSPNNTTQNEESSLITNKLLKLEEARKSKLSTLGSDSTTKINNNQFKDYEDVTITGMEDADTLMLSDGRQVRVSDPLYRYDAAEVDHPEGVGGSIKNAVGLGNNNKSDYAEEIQRQHVGRILGKSANTVTKEDIFSVGNMQQVQALADLARNPGEDRWTAEVEPGAEQVNLNTGLNIPAKIRVSGTDAYGRVLADVVNPRTNENITRLHAQDQRLNAFAPGHKTAGYTIDEKGNVVDTVDRDGMFGESIDIAQSSLIKQYAGSVDALNRVVRSLADKIGVSRDTIDKYIPEDVKIGLVGEGKYTARQLVDGGIADEIAGVMPSTRQEQQTAMNAATKNISDGNYIGAASEVMSVLPYMLGDSAGEIGAIMLGAPGVITAIGNRVNNDAIEYKNNNDGAEPDSQWLLGSTLLNTAALLGEKWVLKSGASAIIEKGLSKSGRAGAVAQSTVGEALQEWYDHTQQTYMTQKEGERTVGEIATSPDSAVAALSGGLMGGSLSGTGQTLAAAKDYVLDGGLGENLKSLKPNSKTGISTPESKISEETMEITEQDKQDASRDLVEINNRLLEDSGVISSSDITRLSEIEDLMNRIDTTPEENKKIVSEIIATARERYKSQLVAGNFDDDVVLKSKEDLMELMDEVYTSTEEDTSTIDNKIYELASKAGIVKTIDEFQSIKKDFESVNKESIDGKRGYLTLGRELKQLIQATTPDSKKIQAKVDRLNSFKVSQQAYVRKAEEMVSEANRIAADYNSSIRSNIKLPEPTQFSGKVNRTGTVIKMNFSKNTDGTFKVNMKGLDSILEAKKKTIKGINNILKTNSTKLSDLNVSDNIVVDNEIVIDTSVSNKKLKQALERVEARIKNNNINKIITVEEPYRNDYTRSVVGLNSSSVNVESYDQSDNVLITIPPEMKELDIKRELAKGGSLYKLIENVRQAGASIHLDAGKVTPDNKVIRAVRRALTKYGPEEKRYSPVQFGSLVLKPTKVAKEIRDNEKAEKEKTKAYKELKNAAEEEAFTKYLEGVDIKEIWETSDILSSSYTDSDSSTGVDKLYRRMESKLNSSSEAIYKAKVNLDIGIRGNKDSATIAILKDELISVEKDAHPKIKEQANIKISQRSNLKGIVNDIKKIKEEKLAPDIEQGRINDLLEDLKTKSTIDVLSQPESGDTFKSNGVNIPLKISKFVKVKDESSILQIVPVDILFDDTLGINKSSIEYVDDVVKFIKETQSLSDKDEVSTKTNTNKRDAELHDSPAIALVLDANGEVNQQVAMAMKLALSEYISFNMNMIDSEYKTREDVAQMIGVLEGQVGPATYSLLKDKGVFNKTAAVKVGTAFMDKMGLGFKKSDGVERELYNKLVADIGNMTLLYAKKAGILEGSEVSVQSFGNARQSDTGVYIDYSGQGEGTVIHTIRMPKRDKDGNLDSKIKEITEEYKVIHEAIAEKNSFERGPLKRPIKVEKSRHIVEKVAKDIIGLDIPNANVDGLRSPKEFIESLVEIKWRVDTKALNRLFALNDSVIKKYLGYATEEDLASMTFDGRSSAISKNREIEKSIEELSKLKTDIENSDGTAYELYFDWFYSSNGRYMMESNTLNPQTDKLHRFIIQPDSHTTTYVIKNGKIFSGSKDVTLEMDYALAQAFGYAVDKESTKNIQKIAQELKDLGYSEIKKLVETGSDIPLKSKTLEIEHLTHALQALDVLQSLENGEQSFSSSITAEYDAVTSGFGLKLMQFPILKDIWVWLNKVGIFQKGQNKHNSMNDILSEADFYDSYQELAKNVKVNEGSLETGDAKATALWEEMFQLLPQSVDDSVSKELRTLFKDPFMTFNYSAGIKSIKASLANKLSTGILDKIVKRDPKYSEITKQLSTYAGKSEEQLIEELKTRPTESIKISPTLKFISVGAGKGNKKYNIKDVLDAIMEETYGAQVEDIMTTKFGQFIEINNMVNSSFKAMFDAFKVKYDAEKSKYPVGELTEDAFNDIMSRLKSEFPLIKGPLSSGIDDGIGIYDLGSQNVSDDSARYRPAQTKTGSKELGKRTLKVRHAIKDFEAAISAGSVVPIHYIDGALMAQMRDVTAIHDAIMPKLSESLDSIKAYNKAMFDVNSQYNFLEEVLNMINRVDVTGNKTETQIKTKNSDGEWEYTTMSIESAFDTLRNTVGDTVAEINTKKAEVYSKIHSIGHMAGIPGSMWTTSEENEVVAKPEEVIIQKEEAVDLIDEAVTTISKLIDSNSGKSYKKLLEAIIKDIEGCR